MKKPDFVPQADWDLVVSICSNYNVDPYLIAAIGKHETQWGREGAGRIGWILGYGYYSGSTVKEKYKGLENQVRGALNQFSQWMQSPITLASVTNLAVKHWKSSAPEAWARSVYSIYSSIEKGYTPPPTPTEIPDVSKQISELEKKVSDDIENKILGLTERVSFVEMIAKFVEEFFNKIKKEW
jgi:hypothetical protein